MGQAAANMAKLEADANPAAAFIVCRENGGAWGVWDAQGERWLITSIGSEAAANAYLRAYRLGFVHGYFGRTDGVRL